MLELRTPCRLHFGLLALGNDAQRQYGGVGLMVRKPDVVIHVTPAASFKADGPLADKALSFAQCFAERAREQGLADQVDPVSIHVVRCPRPHTGLGTGTQLGMAVARAMAELIGQSDLTAAQLAGLVGRGERSAIGAHGFIHGGLIVEGGKRSSDALSPLLMAHPFPAAWRIVLITPQRLEANITAEREKNAFNKVGSISAHATDRMCRQVLLGLVPAMLDNDLPGFGQALYDLQQQVGSCFAAAQGGIFADPMLEQIAAMVRDHGIAGVGQSSWGPTMYAVTGDEAAAMDLAATLQRRLDLGREQVLVTQADNSGCSLRRRPDTLRSESPADRNESPTRLS